MAAPVVLLVNSKDAEREFLEEIVKRFDYDAHAVSNAEHALDTFLSKTYAAIIVEVDLPEMSGLEFAREVRRIEAEIQKKTPLIAIFECDSQFDMEELRAFLIEDFLIRPLDAESLRKVFLRHVYSSDRPNLKILTPIPPEQLSDYLPHPKKSEISREEKSF